MTQALRNIAVAALVGVCLALVLQQRMWTFGLGTLLFLAVLWGAGRARAVRLVIARGAPYLAIGAGLALASQAAAVLVTGNMGRSSGLLPHPNIASATSVALVVLLVSSVRGSEGRRFASWPIIALGLVVTAFLLFAAGSRSVMLGLLLAVPASLLIGVRRDGGFVGLLVGVAMLVGAGLAGSLYLRPEVAGLLGTFDRSSMFMTALGVSALSPWIGLGSGAWSAWAPTVEPALPLSVAVHGHSLPLTILMEGGSIGLSAVVILVALGARTLVRDWRRGSSAATAALLIGSVALGVQALVDLTAMYPSVYVPFLLAVLVWYAKRGAAGGTGKQGS